MMVCSSFSDVRANGQPGAIVEQDIQRVDIVHRLAAVECVLPQELLPIMPPSVHRLWVAGSGANVRPVLRCVAQLVEHDARLDPSGFGAGSSSTMRFIYLPKSKTTATLQPGRRGGARAARQHRHARSRQARHGRHVLRLIQWHNQPIGTWR